MKRLILVAMMFATPALAQVDTSLREQQKGARKDAWSVGLSGLRHSLKAGDGNEVLGNSAVVQLGKSYLSETWFWSSSLDIYLGPYEPSRQAQLDVDYVGTGISLGLGTSAQNSNLRSSEGGYGFAIGLSYADVIGRSIGRNRLEEGDPSDDRNRNLIDNYVIRVTNFSLVPSIFFCWLDEARPHGNSPELLRTRLEGFFLNVGIAMPLLVSYKAQYDTRSRIDEESGDIIPADTERESGQLRGYSITIAVTAMLGT